MDLWNVREFVLHSRDGNQCHGKKGGSITVANRLSYIERRKSINGEEVGRLGYA